MEQINRLKAAASAAIACMTALWGWYGWLTLLWLICMALDYLTGSLAAIKIGQWNSERARQGIWHKVGCIAAVVVAAAADLMIGMVAANFQNLTLPFEYTVLLYPLVVVWYTLTELGSITENAVALGAPVPKFLTKALKTVRESIGTETAAEEKKSGKSDP